MKFTTPLCPECGEPAISILEELQVDSALQMLDRETGKYRFAATQPTPYPQSCHPVLSTDGRVNLQCENRHDWLTGMLP